MKKSIKYAGIAAATLLTVAPIAAPVVSNATQTVVKADDTTTYATATDASNWAGQFQDKTLGEKENATMTASNYGTDLKLTPATFAADPLFASTSAYDVKDNNTFAAATATDSVITSVQATAINSGDTSVLSAADVNKILANKLYDGVSFKVNYTYKTDADTSKSASFTFDVNYAAKTPDAATITSAAAKYTTPISVDYNSSTAATQLDASTDVTLTDQDGNNLISDSKNVASVTPNAFYADSEKLAYAGTATKDDLSSNKFGTADKTYYQTITVKSVKGSALDTYLGNATLTNNGSYTINGVSYANTNNGNITPAKDTDGASITLVRAINVGSAEAANWTVTDEKGVVTTKSDAQYYTLHNDNNDLISNRALAKNTAWQYDAVRTNANGDKQYRVSTHEWIPAESVTVNDDSNNNGGNTADGALTVTDLATKKVVNLSTPGTVYFLYNKEGKVSDVRSLAGGSSWLVDKTATDAAGNTYYGVSTDEFVKAGEGVSLAD